MCGYLHPLSWWNFCPFHIYTIPVLVLCGEMVTIYVGRQTPYMQGNSHHICTYMQEDRYHTFWKQSQYMQEDRHHACREMVTIHVHVGRQTSYMLEIDTIHVGRQTSYMQEDRYHTCWKQTPYMQAQKKDTFPFSSLTITISQ